MTKHNFTYQRDDRNSEPNAYKGQRLSQRRSNFRQGGKRAVKARREGDDYRPNSSGERTWNSVGYEQGWDGGKRSDFEIDRVFKELVEAFIDNGYKACY